MPERRIRCTYHVPADPDLKMAGVTGSARAACSRLLRLATWGTKIEIQKTSVGPAGSAAPVKPRYCMGELDRTPGARA